MDRLDGEDAFGRLSRKAAANALGFAEGTLANWATSGIGPTPRKLRGKVFYMAADVRAFALDGLGVAA